MAVKLSKVGIGSKFTDEQLALIRELYGTIASKGNLYEVPEATFQHFIYMAEKYDLDPLSRQIYLTGYLDRSGALNCSIIPGKDGILEIAHRSGQLNGIQTGTRKDESGELIAWARVHRKDMEHPFEIEVEESEYNTRQSTWSTKPKTMLRKVALAQALKMAFSLAGLYSEEEEGSMGDTGPVPSNAPKEQAPSAHVPKQADFSKKREDESPPPQVPELNASVTSMVIKAIRKNEKSGKAYLQGLTDNDVKFVVIKQEDVEALLEMAMEAGGIAGTKVDGTLTERQGKLFLEGVKKSGEEEKASA